MKHLKRNAAMDTQAPENNETGEIAGGCKVIERAAYHEAGHAALMYLFKHPLDRVSIVPDKGTDSLGHIKRCKPPKWFRPHPRMDFRHEKRIGETIMILLGGIEAELLFTGNFGEEGAVADLIEIDAHVTYLFDGAVREKYMAFVQARVHKMINDPVAWMLVQEIASALLEHRELGSGRFRQVCKASMRKAVRLL
jgi:Peptidase family M41